MPWLLASVLVAGLAFAGCSSRGGGAGAAERDDVAPALDGGLDYLVAQRDAGGRWPAGQVPLVAEAAAAAALDLERWPEPVPVARQATGPAEDAGYLASLRPLHAEALVAAAAGDEVRLRQVRDRVLAGFDGRQFGESALLNDDAFALIVLDAARTSWTGELLGAAESLVGNRSADGGWSWSADAAGGETDMTGLVLAGVAAAGALPAVPSGEVLAFLASTATDEGGHSLIPGGAANCDSTVWALRAYALLDGPAPAAAWSFLLDLQQADGGFAYRAGGPSNFLCTAEVVSLLGLVQGGSVPGPSTA